MFSSEQKGFRAKSSDSGIPDDLLQVRENKRPFRASVYMTREYMFMFVVAYMTLASLPHAVNEARSLSWTA